MRATVPPKWGADGQKEYLHRKLILKAASTGFSGLGNAYGRALITLQAVVAIVLLIACANVANLLLARATVRQRELSVRLAIGAGRVRIVRQLLTESLMLAAAGALAGVFFAIWGAGLLVRMLNSSGALNHGQPLDFELDTSPDLTVVAFTALIVVVTTLFFGLLPALRASGAAPNAVLREHGRGSVTGAGGRLTLTNVLVAVQVGLALTLMSAAALFGESFRRILTVDSGFDVHNVVLIPAGIPQALLGKSQRLRVFSEALDRLRRIPGIRSASRSELTPMSEMAWDGELQPDGGIAKLSEEERHIFGNSVSAGYFETIGAKLIAGRDFDEGDSQGAPRVVILGESTARTFWGASNPIGRTIRTDFVNTASGVQELYKVVGVVRDVKYGSLSEQLVKTAFFSAAQEPEPRAATTFEIRLESPESLQRVLPLVRGALMETDKNLSLEFKTFDSQVSDSLIQPRLIAAVSGFFGAVALILAATGLYGVIAYSTARRKTEIGLRMALGATSNNVLWFVLRGTALTLAAGAALGLTAAHFAGKLVESLVFGVRPTDPAVLSAALAVLMAAAAIAAYIPARKATRLDPMDSLRVE